MIYKLVLGDWAKDDHCISKNIFVACNCENVIDIQNAYKTSCKKLGIQFNDGEDYTGRKLSNEDPRIIWSVWQEDSMGAIAYNILNDAGCFDGIDVEEDGNGRFSVVTLDGCVLEECAKVIMNFIALSMPESFSYQIIRENYPCINGYQNDNLNVEFGNGLFI